MTLEPGEFIRRFLIHVLPKGFHRIRHYGLLTNGARRKNLETARQLLNVPPAADTEDADEEAHAVKQAQVPFTCRSCGQPLIIVEVLPSRRDRPANARAPL